MVQSKGKSSLQIVGTHGPTVLREDTKVDGEHLIYDPSDMYYCVARLTTTYHDIFGIKHVSIFDYIRISKKEQRWMHVVTKNGIKYDLEELDDQQQLVLNKRKTIK